VVVLGVVAVMVGLVAWWAGGGQRTRVSVPPRIDGLVREDTPGARDTTGRLLADLARGLPLASTSSAVYAETRGESRSVIFIGGVGVLVSPSTALNRAFHLLTDDVGPVQGVRVVRAGPLGGAAECGFSDSEAGPQAICGWADRRSLGVAIFTNRPVEEAAAPASGYSWRGRDQSLPSRPLPGVCVGDIGGRRGRAWAVTRREPVSAREAGAPG